MFYETFEALCRREKVSPSGLTRKLGMSSSAPGKWRGGSMPDIMTAKKIAEHFGVTLDYLVYGEDRTNTMAHAHDGAAVLQGSQGNNVSVSSQAVTPSTQGFEVELLDIYRNLDLPDKLSLLQTALEMRARGKRSSDGGDDPA